MRFSEPSKASYIIIKISRNDISTLSVKFRITETSQNKIIFSDAMPALLYKFSEQTLQPGPSVSLKCIAKGNPPPTLEWLLDGFPIQRSER